VEEYSWYSLSNNVIVAEILNAASTSATLQKTIFLKPH
jgi:hypothetical protein